MNRLSLSQALYNGLLPWTDQYGVLQLAGNNIAEDSEDHIAVSPRNLQNHKWKEGEPVYDACAVPHQLHCRIYLPEGWTTGASCHISICLVAGWHTPDIGSLIQSSGLIRSIAEKSCRRSAIVATGVSCLSGRVSHR